LRSTPLDRAARNDLARVSESARNDHPIAILGKKGELFNPNFS
jgi:hypothetical protein